MLNCSRTKYPSMLRRVIYKKIGINPKLVLKNLVLLASAFVWYFLAYNFLKDVIPTNTSSFEQLEIMGASIGGIAVSAFFGSFVADRLKKRTPFISWWMFIGVFLSIMPIFLPLSSIEVIIFVSTVFGIYFGLGMPIIMGYFAGCTSPGDRGTIGGVSFLTIGLSFFVLGNIGTGDVVITGVVLAAIRFIGLVLFLLLEGKVEPNFERKKPTYRCIIQNRPFVLYLIPWIMFNMVDYFTVPITESLFPESLVLTSSVFENILIGIFAVLTGFWIDTKGRKRAAILGFAILGLGYASLGFFPGNDYGWYFYTAADGIAWGILNVIFLFTVWGDLAQRQNGEKFYVLGAIPYLLSSFMYSFISQIFSETVQIFTFASFFLFIAILPLVYAPETLPEKIMKEKDLKFYVEKAQKIAQKYY